MTRLTQRQWMDVLNRAVEQAGREAASKYGLKKKAKPRPKTKSVPKAPRKVRAAAAE